MESSLGRKCKANEIDYEYGLNKVWEIVTYAEKWYFMNVLRTVKGNYRLSCQSPYIENEGIKVLGSWRKKILGHITWLLKEAQRRTWLLT